jgi:Tol biopolymer transport system component
MRVRELIYGSVLLASSSTSAAFAQSTELVSVTTNGQPSLGAKNPSISADGRFVAFESGDASLVPGDTNGKADIFVRDRLTGVTTRVSVDSFGAQANDQSRCPAISADGRFVAFTSAATNLVPSDTNGKVDVFEHDRLTGATRRVSVDSSGQEANGSSPLGVIVTISSDGRYVAFPSDASNLVPGDTNGASDVFVHDRVSGQTIRASVDSSGNQASLGAYGAAISADGRWVAFSSASTNLTSAGVPGAFIHDMLTGATTLASVSSNGTPGNDFSGVGELSADGRYLAFPSAATNLVPNDTNFRYDVFVHDRVTGQTTRASVNATNDGGDDDSVYSAISADGRYVAFESRSTNLVPFDTNLRFDAFVRDLQTGQTTRVNVANDGAQSIGDSDFSFVSISADGRTIAFASSATDLIPGDTIPQINVFVRDRGANPPVAFCFGDGTQMTACPCANIGSTWRGCQNSAGTGGAVLTTSGVTSPDTLVLVSMAELPHALSIFLQGDTDLSGVAFGDGVRCVGGTLRRLYSKNAVGGVVSAPSSGDPSITARSAALGDPIAPGSTRSYQVYYRDPNLAFCPSPMGDAWNVSSANRVVW